METTLIKCSNNLLPTIDNLRIHNDKYDQISCSLYLSHNKDESKKKNYQETLTKSYCISMIILLYCDKNL